MIGNRHIFVIRQQRVVRPEQLAHRRRVVNRGEKIGVVADAGRQCHPGIGLRHQHAAQRRLVFTAAAQRPRQGQPQGAPGGTARAHEGIEFCALQQGRRLFGRALEDVSVECRVQIKNLIANGDTDPHRRCPAFAAERTVGQILDREVATGSVGRAYPAGKCGVVGFVKCHADTVPMVLRQPCWPRWLFWAQRPAPPVFCFCPTSVQPVCVCRPARRP